MNADQRQLAAGGLVPVAAKLDRGDAVDTVVARAYRHAVLPGRVVVRLTAEGLVRGDDLEMGTLGFGPGTDRGRVAKERRRPLGFPGWALIHDPDNARYALDVVQELEQAMRRAKSKPGFAKEAIDKLGARLGTTVPQFLPSFYEEAGRRFIALGNPNLAATCFGKAREAEAVHALEVDEQHRIDAFLEFALAGAVTTKALTDYAKELASHHEPAAAFAHFRELALHRTLGGVPPWAGMARELQRLAKAAKLDVDAEDRAFVEAIIGSPVLASAPTEFWRAYRAPIAALGARSTEVRAALVNLFPVGGGSELDEAWLDLLEDSGALAVLVDPSTPPDALPPGGRALWFDKLCEHLGRSSDLGPRPFALLRRIAPALIADAAPIHCTGRYHKADLDLCELALELGVSVEAREHAQFALPAWAKRAAEPGFGHDPVRTAAHRSFGLGSEPASPGPRRDCTPLHECRSAIQGLVGAGRGSCELLL